jgi:phage protein D
MAEGYVIHVGGSPNSALANANPIEVHERLGEPTRFQLTTSAELSLLSDDSIGPDAEVTIFAPDGTDTACLVKGPIISHRVQLRHNDTSILDVIGADNSIKLDRENKAAVHENTTDSQAVQTVLQSGGFNTVDADDTSAQYTDTTHSLVQRESDFQFVRRLARNNGFLFWLTCDSTGNTETAHFKRPPVDGDADIDLVINLSDRPANVQELTIEWDTERPTSGDAEQQDIINKSSLTATVPMSPLTPLGTTPLSSIATGTRTVHVYAPADDQAGVQARLEGALIEHTFFLVARGTTTAAALGRVLRAHTVVNLLGAGSRYSGKWFCGAVKHTITDTEHRMDFELIRESWGATA